MKLSLPNKEIFPSIIGIKRKDFDRLLPKFSRELRKAEYQNYLRNSKRERAFGAGRTPKAFKTDEEKLFFILFYYKVYPTVRLAEYLFELDHTNIKRWKDFLEVVLNNTVSYQLQLPIRRVRCLSELITVYPALKDCIVDATERPVRRPKDPTNESKYFSGKKNDHKE